MTSKLLIGMSALSVLALTMPSTASAGAGARADRIIDIQSRIQKVALRPPDIRRSLRTRGYYNIRFTDRTLPVYRVKACKNGKRFRIRLNRWGEIRKRVRIGWCDDYGNGEPFLDGLSLPQIRRSLRHRGYYNIRFTDRRLPGYRARACKRGKRFLLYLNRFGRIMDRERRGWCGFGLYRDELREEATLYLDGPGLSITLGKKHKHDR